MAIRCPNCGAQYDVTLFTFDRRLHCDCGAWVDLAVGHQQTSEVSKQAPQEMTMHRLAEERRAEETELLANIKGALPRLLHIWQQANGHWGYEDPVYRFYHQSFKVYYLQAQTLEIARVLQDLAPPLPLNPWFMQIVTEGTAGEFSMEVNARWLEATRPILEAFFHARYLLEMVCKYGQELDEPPEALPSGWAAVLCLYGLR